MAPRIAKSLEVLRHQINEAFPKRGKANDGWIGDKAHQATASDHNPNDNDVVTALDITHDPKNGVDANKLVAALVRSRDPRIKYVIWNKRIISATTQPWVWRASKGHTAHFHVSVVGKAAGYDSTKLWNLDETKGKAAAVDKAPAPPVAAVKFLQSGLNGLGTSPPLVVDGIIGDHTLDAMDALSKRMRG